MTLLLILEKAQLWDQVVALSAETDRLQVFQDNRALLKLIWARALREKGELLGAKAALKDASQYMENTPEDNPEGKDIWGRFYYVKLITQQRECQALSAQTSGKKKLYSTWLEAEVDCWKLAFTQGVETFRLDNDWSKPSQDSLALGAERLGEKITAYMKELKSLEPRRNLQKLSRQQLYRALESIDATMKNFKERALNSTHLEQLRKKIDLLLVSI